MSNTDCAHKKGCILTDDHGQKPNCDVCSCYKTPTSRTCPRCDGDAKRSNGTSHCEYCNLYSYTYICPFCHVRSEEDLMEHIKHEVTCA